MYCACKYSLLISVREVLVSLLRDGRHLPEEPPLGRRSALRSRLGHLSREGSRERAAGGRLDALLHGVEASGREGEHGDVGQDGEADGSGEKRVILSKCRLDGGQFD